jgi:hypothetical protein
VGTADKKVEGTGLGLSLARHVRGAARYVDKILKGAKPASSPSSSPPSSSWSLISRLRKCSDSRSRNRCCCGRIR